MLKSIPSLLLLLLTLAAHPALAALNADGIDLSSIPTATTPQQSYDTFAARAEKVLDFFARQNQNPFGFDHGVDFWLTAIGKLATGRDVESVNRALLDPNAKVYSRVGTDFHDLGFLCARTGDYDFMLRGLVELFYRFGDNPALIRPETRAKFLGHFLNQRGNKVHLRNNLWVCGTHDETENHILQTETSRYLTNHLVTREQHRLGRSTPEYDNEANGMNRWMLFHLQQFFKNDFSEYNSHPYQAYTVMAIQNLAEFAEDTRVRLAAEMLLNYLDAKFAVSSLSGRRYVPFRRQKAYNTRTDMLAFDDESQRFQIMAGDTRLLSELPIPNYLEFGMDRMEGPALGAYRTPELILDLALNKAHNPYWQRFRHTGVELYASSKSFLVSGGGIWIDIWDWWTHQDSGWAVPTTLLPAAGGLDASEFIRIDGHTDLTKRINTCVAPGFACGLNPVVPDFVPEACLERRGDWTFADFTRAACPLRYGFYAAVYGTSCDTRRCRKGGGRFGFFEAAEPVGSFEDFRDRILAANGNTRFHAERENVYITSDGRWIRFVPLPRDKWTWGLHSIDGDRFNIDIEHWPLATGEVFEADGSGLVTIRNAYLRRQLVLDMRDPLHPARREEPL